MKKLLIILTISTFFACDSKDDILGPKFSSNKAVNFSVINAQGEDLLNPQNPNHIDQYKIKLFYVVNGTIQGENQKNIMLYKYQNEYRINVMMNDNQTNDKSITYIQWNEKDTDTLETTYIRGENFTYSKDVWLNTKLISEDVQLGESPYVKLIK